MDKLDGQLITVFGGGGFLGRYVVQRLLARGHAIGHPDGVLGTASREAIKREQARLGMTADGRAGTKLLKALREGR